MILLPLYIEENTSEMENFEIEKHLTECPECMEKYTSLQAIALKIKSAFDSVENQHFEKEKSYFNENLCAYLDNELSDEDYLTMTKILIDNDDAKKDAEEMSDFDKKLHKSLNENNQVLQDFSSDIIKKVKKNAPDYTYKLYVKAIIMTVVFITLTLLIGYFSSQSYFYDFRNFANLSLF